MPVVGGVVVRVEGLDDSAVVLGVSDVEEVCAEFDEEDVVLIVFVGDEDGRLLLCVADVEHAWAA